MISENKFKCTIQGCSEEGVFEMALTFSLPKHLSVAGPPVQKICLCKKHYEQIMSYNSSDISTASNQILPTTNMTKVHDYKKKALSGFSKVIPKDCFKNNKS